jgi:hypothetical protein
MVHHTVHREYAYIITLSSHERYFVRRFCITRTIALSAGCEFASGSLRCQSSRPSTARRGICRVARWVDWYSREWCCGPIRLHLFSVCSQDTEKSKVLQSIASVIQALPPEEEIPPVLAIVSPVVEKLEQALRSSSRVCVGDASFVTLSEVT